MSSETDELRMAIVFRPSLDMPRGKSEVQFGHAIAMLMIAADQELVAAYMAGSQLKLSMEADDEVAFDAILSRAGLRGVTCVKVVDAGRTVFGEPTFTCIGLGPMNKTDCNALTRHARMRA